MAFPQPNLLKNEFKATECNQGCFSFVRRVCETILSSPKFTFKDEKVWHRGCHSIYQSVKQMDYRVS